MTAGHLPLLQVRDLAVGFGPPGDTTEIVSRIDFTIGRGEALGLVGESGSGKSTVAAAVLDLLTSGLRVLSGEIAFEGSDLRRLDASVRRKMLGSRIGAVFQDPFTSLNPSFRIGEQIAEPLRVHRGVSAPRAYDIACSLLADVGIADVERTAQAYQHQLSGGMRQRALIAMALACDPPLLVLDEPTTALDAEVESQFLSLLLRLRQERGLSLLFISHNLAVIRKVCDRVAVLYAGEIVEQGAVDAVLAEPAHPYTRALVGCIPRIDLGRRQVLRPIRGSLPLLGERIDGCRFAKRCDHALPGCDQPQALTAHGERLVRCWRAAEIDGIPKSEGRVSRDREIITVDDDDVILGASRISKSYTQGTFWQAVRFGGDGFPITLRYPRFDAVKDMTLQVRRGEVLGLVGQSGSGKSSFGRLIVRIDDPTSGRIEFSGEDITHRSPRQLRDFRRRAQMVFQNPDSSLNPRVSIGHVLARPLQLFGIANKSDVTREVDRLLELVRLPASYKGRYAHQLSGGEKQRVGIARAIATRPELLVCDEPVSALDVSVQAAIINLIEDLRDELKLSVLFISHDIAVVAHLCDRIAVMYRGELCEIGPSAQVLGSPSHPYTRKLLAAVESLGTAHTREGADADEALVAARL
jgi:peptide/nickel transport system ATP-binding protein